MTTRDALIKQLMYDPATRAKAEEFLQIILARVPAEIDNPRLVWSHVALEIAKIGAVNDAIILAQDKELALLRAQIAELQCKLLPEGV